MEVEQSKKCRVGGNEEDHSRELEMEEYSKFMEETEEVEGGVIVGKEHDFSISKEKAEWLYEKAGELIPEDSAQITVDKFSHLNSGQVHLVIQEVLQETSIHPLLKWPECLSLVGAGMRR